MPTDFLPLNPEVAMDTAHQLGITPFKIGTPFITLIQVDSVNMYKVESLLNNNL